MPLPLVLALRSLFFRRVQTALAVLGVTLGVLALTTMLGIQNGFREAFVRQILETTGDVTISARGQGIHGWEQRVERLRAEVPHVTGAAPAILGQGILEVDHAFAGINFKAIDPEHEPSVTRILDQVVAGQARFTGVSEVLVGSRLAGELGLSVGDPVKLVLPGGNLYDMWVRGIFETGVSQLDAQTVVVTLRFAARAMKFRDAVSHIYLSCDHPDNADEVADRAEVLLGLSAESWMDTHQTLLKAMELERRAMFVIIALTLMVAGFGISNVLTLMVYEKHRDVGILRSMGAGRAVILQTFLLQGLLIGLAGTFCGVLCSLGLGELLETFPIPLAGDIYYANTLPVRFVAREFAAIGLLSLAVATLAGIPSAVRALQVDPLEVIHGAQ